MRRTLLTAATAALVASSAFPAFGHATGVQVPTAPIDVTHWKTDNVEHLGRFPEHAGTAGGRLVGDTFFITDGRGVHAYDVTDPASPARLGSLILPQSGTGQALAQEDPDTDGKILLVDAIDPESGSTSGSLKVVDVSDPANMEVVGAAGVSDHTWNCVSKAGSTSCDFAYGRTGHIVDLTDPTEPKVLAQKWRTEPGIDYSLYTHDLTQVAPGLTMTAGQTALLLDTRNPAEPKLLAELGRRQRFSSLGFHSVEWANQGLDPIVVTGTEIAPNGSLAGTDCDDDANAVIETWDASGFNAAVRDFLATGDTSGFSGETFTQLDSFDAGGQGIFLQGQHPSHVLYCAHWMETQPSFDGEGRMAVSYYDRGTRFVDIAADGTMEEHGWVVGADGYSGSPQWITDEIVYIMDYRRGLEVVRVDDAEATGVVKVETDILAANSDVEAMMRLVGAHGHIPWSTITPLGLGIVGLGAAIWRRREGAIATA